MLYGQSGKKAMPVLSFPSTSLLGITVKELIDSSEKQAEGMRLVAELTDAAASVSMMDLSVEAEAFGAEIRISDDEVPTVIGAIVQSEEEAEALAVPPSARDVPGGISRPSALPAAGSPTGRCSPV